MKMNRTRRIAIADLSDHLACRDLLTSHDGRRFVHVCGDRPEPARMREHHAIAVTAESSRALRERVQDGPGQDREDRRSTRRADVPALVVARRVAVKSTQTETRTNAPVDAQRLRCATGHRITAPRRRRSRSGRPRPAKTSYRSGVPQRAGALPIAGSSPDIVLTRGCLAARS